MSYYYGAHMSYSVVKELDNQLENVAEGSEKSYALACRIAEVLDDFCDAVASKLPDSEIRWTSWEFQGKSVVIQAILDRLDIAKYDFLVEKFETDLDTGYWTPYSQQNPWGVSAESYEYCRGRATDLFHITLVMK